jgi:hypothetical protein
VRQLLRRIRQCRFQFLPGKAEVVVRYVENASAGFAIAEVPSGDWRIVGGCHRYETSGGYILHGVGEREMAAAVRADERFFVGICRNDGERSRADGCGESRMIL